MKYHIGLLLSLILLYGCSDNAENDVDVWSNKSSTMKACLNSIKKETAGTLEISTDTPEKVAGSLNGDANLVFWCEKKETGSEGTYYEGVFSLYKNSNSK